MFLYLYRCPAIDIPSINGMVISSTETVEGNGVVDDDDFLLGLSLDVSIVDIVADVVVDNDDDIGLFHLEGLGFGKEGEGIIILWPEKQHTL